MRAIAVMGPNAKGESCSTFSLEGIPVTVGCVQTKVPPFDPNSEDFKNKVLVNVKAFSCNYRDKYFILLAAKCAPEATFYPVGSEFAGQVLAVGREVKNFKPNDRVIADNCWPSTVAGVRAGVPTNHASKETLVVHETKLAKIPEGMSDEIAAAFGVGAQTSYSMIRKLNVQPGSNVLVTAAKSNTSLFAINGLRRSKANIYCVSRTSSFEKELKNMGVRELVQINETMEHFGQCEQLQTVVSENGGFDCVFDPFFDLHLDKVISVMNFGGRYVTCGLYDQFSDITGGQSDRRKVDWQSVMRDVILKNIHIIGDCLGATEDISRAVSDYASGTLHVVMDRVYRGGRVGAFFERTYNDPNRFGKVVYCYDS